VLNAGLNLGVAAIADEFHGSADEVTDKTASTSGVVISGIRFMIDSFLSNYLHVTNERFREHASGVRDTLDG
jgi:hypothetical protein